MAQGTPRQLLIDFNAVRNSDLFSNHWLENRLPLEPEWKEVHAEAYAAIETLSELWKVQKKRVEKYDGEQMLEEQFIQPVLRALGWKDRMLYQTFLRGRKPDYALFLDDGQVEMALAKGKNHPDFWKSPVMLADAKAWAVSLDRKATVEAKREYPPEQIEWYLNNSQLDYAILTNGRLWRLVPRQHDPGQARFQTYLEVDLPQLLDERMEVLDSKVWPGFDDFLRFFLFFSPVAHRETAERPSLIRRARAGSSEYRLGVGAGLKQRVFDALSLCIEGFVRHEANSTRRTS
jgi:hypothetical protein